MQVFFLHLSSYKNSELANRLYHCLVCAPSINNQTEFLSSLLFPKGINGLPVIAAQWAQPAAAFTIEASVGRGNGSGVSLRRKLKCTADQFIKS